MRAKTKNYGVDSQLKVEYGRTLHGCDMTSSYRVCAFESTLSFQLSFGPDPYCLDGVNDIGFKSSFSVYTSFFSPSSTQTPNLCQIEIPPLSTTRPSPSLLPSAPPIWRRKHPGGASLARDSLMNRISSRSNRAIIGSPMILSRHIPYQ